MFSLLPENEKDVILKEYRARRQVILAVFVFALSVIASISLFPSFLLSSIRTKEIEQQLSTIRESPVLQERVTLDKTLVDTNRKLELLRVGTTTIFVKDLVDDILESKGTTSIRINGLLYKREAGKVSNTLSITGVARDRETLSFFVKELEKRFSQVNLPVSNFAREKNPQFTIEVKGF